MISNIPELKGSDNGSGMCIHLNGNLCDIYDMRPYICNVEHMYNSVYANKMTEDEFIHENLKVCYTLNKLFGNIDDIKKIEELIKLLI